LGRAGFGPNRIWDEQDLGQAGFGPNRIWAEFLYRELRYDYWIFLITGRFSTLGGVEIMYDFSFSINKTLTPLAEKKLFWALVFLS